MSVRIASHRIAYVGRILLLHENFKNNVEKRHLCKASIVMKYFLVVAAALQSQISVF